MRYGAFGTESSEIDQSGGIGGSIIIGAGEDSGGGEYFYSQKPSGKNKCLASNFLPIIPTETWAVH